MSLFLIKLRSSCLNTKSNYLFNTLASVCKRTLNVTKHIQYKNYSNTVANTSLNVNTNVVKDVTLFKYDKPRFYRILNIFALCQFGFWGYLSHFAFYHLKDAPVPRVPDEQEIPWWRRFNLGENKYRNTIAILSFMIGYGILVIAWMYTLRSVRYLILRKGGTDVTFVTYTPFGTNRLLTVNLKHVSCKETRAGAPAQLPIKVQNHYLHYILDMRGEFKNTALFDHTAGLKRTFKSV